MVTTRANCKLIESRDASASAASLLSWTRWREALTSVRRGNRVLSDSASMALNPGFRLGPYEIQSPLGAGGMGEVYKARDTRLERIVAIKVLPGQVAADPQLRERFEREARAISSLSHPHICALHDVGSQDGIDFLVMEYLDGETLADRIARDRLSVAESLHSD